MKSSAKAFILLLTGLAPLLLQAQDDHLPWEEYGKLINDRTTIEPLGTDLFGDQINLYNTALSFSATDISLPGNNELQVALTRTFSVKSRKAHDRTQKDLPMGTWDLDLPRLEGVFAPTWHEQRCDGPVKPPTVGTSGGGEIIYFDPDEGDRAADGGGDETLPVEPGYTTYAAHQYWHGYHAHMPGGGEMIQAEQPANASGPPTPKPDTPNVDYHWMTSKFTYFSCLDDDIQNGAGPGQGFLAITADGTKYWFNWMAQYYEPSVKWVESGNPGTASLERKRNVLYATKVEDRFGNWVTYTFSNDYDEPARLELIESSDGREIKLTYDAQGRVHNACDRNVPNCNGADTNTWTYQYGTSGDLIGVHLPDGSAWTINFSGLWNVEIVYENEPNTPRNCDMTDIVLYVSGLGSGTVTHPSGATGLFEVDHLIHSRSKVPKYCYNYNTEPPIDENDDIAIWPRQYDLLGIARKLITGPGLADMEWTFTSTSDRSWWTDENGNIPTPVCDTKDPPCDRPRCLDDSCAGVATTTVSTTVSGTGTEWTRYTFGNSYRYNEGKLLKVERGTTGTNDILRTEEMEYELAHTGTSFPVPIGDTSHNNRGNVFAAAYLAPLKKRTITQQGMPFRYTVNEFDQFARPVDALRQRGNSPDDRREVVTDYHDHPGKWILGQIESVTMKGRKRGVDDVTVVAEQTAYSSNLALPLVRWRFGKIVQTLSWDTFSTPESGQLGTVRTHRDGNNNTTTLTNWKRGIPQTISYADGESASAVVNNNGTIASVTDENGYKTCYEYDGMGRLALIKYPSETQSGVCDTSTWNPTTQTFVQSTSSIYGIGAGHWRQTVSTGNGHRITYFDALWRPLVVREYDSANQPATQRFSRFEHDHKGRTTYASYPSANSAANLGVHTTYDALGRVTEVLEDSELTGEVKTTTEYEPGYTTLVTDPNGNGTKTWYQGFDEPDYSAPLLIHHEENAYTTFARDFLGQVDCLGRGYYTGSPNLLDLLYGNGLVDPCENVNNTATAVREYVYNNQLELCKIVEPETGATIMAYDGAGNLEWSKSGSSYTSTSSCDTGNIPEGERTKREYDERNRITSLRFPDGRGNTYYYYWLDGLQWKITADNGDGNIITTLYDYNRRRLPTRERIKWNSANWAQITIGYNANGHISTHTYPLAEGESVSYAPNALGQPTRVGSFATGAIYHANGALKEFTYGNGIVHTLSQNDRALPYISTDARDGTKFVDDTYHYDENGNVEAIRDGATGTNFHGDRDMTYDGLNRLTQVTSSMFGTATYSYDELDNLKRVWLTGGINARDYYLCYASNSNRLANIRTGTCSGNTVISFGYDDQGNLETKTGATFDFDYGNRLREANVDGVTTPYVYDGLGRRVQDGNASGLPAQRNSVYGRDGKLLSTSSWRSFVNRFYYYLGNRLVAVRQGIIQTPSTTIYQHTDALGSPVVITDANSNILERREYEPYGMQIQPTPEDGVGYTGHVYDAATGLNYMQQRYYDPAIGRFISADPVRANPQTGANFNRYWYADNNPYTFVDLDGRRATIKDDKIFIQPEDKSVPAVTVQNNVGAQGLSPSDRYFHDYNPSTPSNLTAAQAGEGFKNNPTPGNDAPASKEGTRNNAGHLPVLPGANNVRSFFVPSPDSNKYTDVTVNYTIAGEHKLNEGFVIRFGEINADGTVTLRSYGEGNNWRQGGFLEGPASRRAENVWQRNHREIIDNAR